MKKIVIITTAWYGGGAETVARESYEYFTKKGYECYFACSRGDAPQGVKQIKIGSKKDLYMHAIMARLFDAAGRGSSSATKKFVNQLEKIKPDIVLIHNIVCYTVNLKILFEYLNNSSSRVLWTLHECWSFTGHCGFFDMANCQKWKIKCGNCPLKKDYPKSVLIDNSRNNLSYKKKYIGAMKDLCLITPSQWLKNLVGQTYLSKYKTIVINNGINIDAFQPMNSNLKTDYSIGNRKILLGVASIWGERKGLKYFIDLDRLIDHQEYIIVLIGVSEKIKESVPGSILALPRTNSFDELIKWYTVADFFLNPTLADNFPTVNLEALACGTPVITFDTGGSWESVGEEYGQLVKDKSAQGLLEAIAECEKKKITSSSCRKHAMKYSTNNAYEKYIEVIEKM